MGFVLWGVLGVILAVLSCMVCFASLVVQRHREDKEAAKIKPTLSLDAKPGGEQTAPAAGSSTVRRRSSAHVIPSAESQQPPPQQVEQRRLSFRSGSPPPAGSSSSPVPDGGRRGSLLSGSPAEQIRRNSALGLPPSGSSDTILAPPQTPSSPRLRKQTSNKGVKFVTPDTSPISRLLTSDGLPVIKVQDELGGHSDAVESAAFSEDGLLATGGGPEDVFVKVYNKGMGVVGSLRHTINVQRDCGKHDGASILSFALDEGKKSTLLLVGTRTERLLMGYKLSKSAHTPPLLVFTFETKHGAPLVGVAGFIPAEATNFFDPGVFLATCSRGNREVKIWSPKGNPLYVVDCECWTGGVRLSPHGRHLAVLSTGGGPGVVFDIKSDKNKHLKFNKTKLLLPIDVPGSSAPLVSSRRSVVGDLASQAAQDLLFHADDPGADLVSCRVDTSLHVARVLNVDTASSWDVDAVAKPESLLTASPTHTCVFIPKAEGRQMHVIVARGKNVFFFDTALTLLGVLEGRREDGDVLGISLSPKADFVVIVAFGATVARLVVVE